MSHQLGEQKPGRLKRKPWLLGTRRSGTKGKYGWQRTRCETSASTGLPLVKLYSFAEPQFPYLLNGNDYAIRLTRLSLGLDETMDAKCLMLSQYLRSRELVSDKECLGCFMREGAWKQVLRTKKRKWRSKGNKKNCPAWYLGTNLGISKARTSCLVFFLLYRLTYCLITGLSKRPPFPCRLCLAHHTSIWPCFVSVNS